MSIVLGVRARDKVTGFEGVVTARAEYLTGCAQYCIVPGVMDSKLPDAHWFDEARIEVVGDGVAAREVQGAASGGPQRDAPKV